MSEGLKFRDLRINVLPNVISDRSISISEDYPPDYTVLDRSGNMVYISMAGQQFWVHQRELYNK